MYLNFSGQKLSGWLQIAGFWYSYAHSYNSFFEDNITLDCDKSDIT